jgi:hypothetical protein
MVSAARTMAGSVFIFVPQVVLILTLSKTSPKFGQLIGRGKLGSEQVDPRRA